MGPRRFKWSGMGSEIKMIPGLLYQKTTRVPNASQKNDSGELSLKGFRVQGSGFKGFKGFKGFRWRLRRILDDGIPVSSAFPSRGRCPEGARRRRRIDLPRRGSLLRDGMKGNVRSPVFSFRHPERSRGIFYVVAVLCTYEVMIKSRGCFVCSSSDARRLTVVQGRFLASLEMTIQGV